MFQWLTSNLLWTAGSPILIGILVAAAICWFVYPPLTYFLVLPFFLFCFWFFRNPTRTCIQCKDDPTLLVAPADGKVVAVDDIDYEEDGIKYGKRISIFLSVFDVHVNWVPCAGTVTSIKYRPGKFAVAMAPKSSEINERNQVTIEMPNGTTVMVRQIAGLIARRIIWWISVGDVVSYDQKFGMIRFGSRTDILIPSSSTVSVEVGQRTIGGETIIGKVADAQS